MNIGVILNRKKNGAEEALAAIQSAIGTRGRVLVCPDSGAAPGDAREPSVDFFEGLDVVISLGGDGTMLHSVQLMGTEDIPIMGINLGTLGFMTTVLPDQIEEAMRRLLVGDYAISERTRLQLRVTEGDSVNTHYALNDVAIGWGGSPRIISLKVSIDHHYVTTYACDGLVVSTPTGSTGHSLSAGGPILQPDTEVFVISPICPHTLTSRPLVISNRSVIGVELDDCAKELLLAVDGQECCSIGHGTLLEMEAFEKRVQFIHFHGYDYYAVLREKLRWQGSSRLSEVVEKPPR